MGTIEAALRHAARTPDPMVCLSFRCLCAKDGREFIVFRCCKLATSALSWIVGYEFLRNERDPYAPTRMNREHPAEFGE